MTHPLEAFASSLDLDASKVTNSPSLVLLCGGPIQAKLGADPSLRELFHHHLEDCYPDIFEKVVLAEEANEWVRSGRHYDNLFDLENDLAALSAVILVFVESAGSIAELGAFCQAAPLRDKLVAILEHSHQDDTSFIKAGPVELLRRHHSKGANPVHFLPWLRRPNKHGQRRLLKSAARETVDKFARWLSDYMRSLPDEVKFQKGEAGHRLLLIADSISLCTILLKKDIASFLKGLGIAAPPQDLDKHLFLLEKLRLIDRTDYGNNTYYVAGGESAKYIDYAYKEVGKNWDRQQASSDLTNQLAELDPDRKKAWKHFGKHRAVGNG